MRFLEIVSSPLHTACAMAFAHASDAERPASYKVMFDSAWRHISDSVLRNDPRLTGLPSSAAIPDPVGRTLVLGAAD